MSSDTGYVAGTIQTVDDGTIGRSVLLVLKRDAGGRWKIASESAASKKPLPYTEPITADRIIESMDKGGIKRALVLSEAFWVGGPGSERTKRLKPAPNKVAAVRLENDWAAAQVARFPDRLSLACGINPLEDYAAAELNRCAGASKANAVKTNVGEGGDNMDFGDAADVAKLRNFFAAADRVGMPIVIHLWSKGGFGRKEARIFLNEIMSAAPNIAVQIAHMSSGFQQPEALREFAEARSSKDPLANNLYFDLSVGSFADLPTEQGAFLADMIRKIGLEHVLYASDELPGDHYAPTWKHWLEVRQNLPLTVSEFAAIADNVAPYMRPR
jgi:predicted TIM-barrel fold metal-dependent hydrolase